MATRKPPTLKRKAIATLPYDVAEQLRTPDEMTAYLDAWLEEALDDVAGVARALGDISRAERMHQGPEGKQCEVRQQSGASTACTMSGGS